MDGGNPGAAHTDMHTCRDTGKVSCTGLLNRNTHPERPRPGDGHSVSIHPYTRSAPVPARPRGWLEVGQAVRTLAVLTARGSHYAPPCACRANTGCARCCRRDNGVALLGVTSVCSSIRAAASGACALGPCGRQQRCRGHQYFTRKKRCDLESQRRSRRAPHSQNKTIFNKEFPTARCLRGFFSLGTGGSRVLGTPPAPEHLGTT